MHVRGCEWVVDAHGCDPERLADVDALRTLFAHITELLDLRPVADAQWHRFPAIGHTGGGVTGVCLLAESHLTVHTYPEHGSLCLNVFCCRVRPDWDVAAALQPVVGGTGLSVRVRRIERDLASPASVALAERRGLHAR